MMRKFDPTEGVSLFPTLDPINSTRVQRTTATFPQFSDYGKLGAVGFPIGLHLLAPAVSLSSPFALPFPP